MSKSHVLYDLIRRANNGQVTASYSKAKFIETEPQTISGSIRILEHLGLAKKDSKAELGCRATPG